MGADSWQEICTWREWEKVLVDDESYRRDAARLRDRFRPRHGRRPRSRSSICEAVDADGLRTTIKVRRIYITDAVELDVSATEIRDDVSEDDRLDREDRRS